MSAASRPQIHAHKTCWEVDNSSTFEIPAEISILQARLKEKERKKEGKRRRDIERDILPLLA